MHQIICVPQFIIYMQMRRLTRQTVEVAQCGKLNFLQFRLGVHFIKHTNLGRKRIFGLVVPIVTDRQVVWGPQRRSWRRRGKPVSFSGHVGEPETISGFASTFLCLNNNIHEKPLHVRVCELHPDTHVFAIQFFGSLPSGTHVFLTR